MLARQGSGVFLDLAAGGYQPGASQPGVLLYPPQGTGAMVWTGFDEAPAIEAAAWPDLAHPPLWRVEIAADPATLAITAAGRRQSAARGQPALVLPLAESRAITLNGARWRTPGAGAGRGAAGGGFHALKKAGRRRGGADRPERRAEQKLSARAQSPYPSATAHIG
jgi:hypothetical protein